MVMLIAACGDATGETGPSKKDPVGEWVLVDGAVDDVAIALVDGYRVTMNLRRDGEVGGTAACNAYGGSFRIVDDRLVFGELGSTAMGCEPSVMAVEQAFLNALSRPLTPIREEGTLLLSGVGVALTFEEVRPVPTAALVGTEWVLETLIEGDVATAAGGDPATLRLTDGGEVEGSTGCRTLRGEYTITADTVLFTTFSADGECPTALERQDGHVVTVLGDGFTVAIDGGTLTVTSPGPMGLVYRAAP